MKNVQLTIKVCDNDKYFIGTIKLVTKEKLIPAVVAEMRAQGISTRGYEVEEFRDDQIQESNSEIMSKASLVFADIISMDFRKSEDETEKLAPTFN